jgi:hypothetical protein
VWSIGYDHEVPWIVLPRPKVSGSATWAEVLWVDETNGPELRRCLYWLRAPEQEWREPS